MISKIAKFSSKSLVYKPVFYNAWDLPTFASNSPNATNDLRISLSTGEVPFFKIVLTGGPCSGKSSSLKCISKQLSKLGFKVYTVPEVSTFTQESTGLIEWGKLSLAEILRFQIHFMMTQFALEDYFTNLALIQRKPSVILCDRGLMDSKAYLDEEAWQLLLDEQNWNHIMLRDKRYDGVLHLVTTADGAEASYSSSNNQIRTEDASLARIVDMKLRQAWCGHTSHMVIDNSCPGGFEAKLERVYNAVCHIINKPSTGHLHKYLIEDSFILPQELRVEKVMSEIIYLKSEDDFHERKITKRGLLGQNSYFKVLKKYDKNDQVIQYTSYPLTAIQYLRLSHEGNPNRKKLQIEETCFIWEGRTYTIYKYMNLNNPLTVLRLTIDSDQIKPKIPTFIKVVNSITGVSRYTGFKISEHENSASKQRITVHP